MVKSRNQFPREGEFIVGKVADIQNQYVYVDLEDYEGLPSEERARGMIHVSEISSRWIKNIRNYVRVGQRIVLRVLRVDESKGHVDLSLRRVNSAQKKSRMKEWKYATKYEMILRFLADDIKKSLDEVYEIIGFPVLELFKDNYQETIEELKENGIDIVEAINDVPEDIKKKFLQIIDENVEISTVNIKGKIKMIFTSENGIELIKEILGEAEKVIENPKETRKLNISYIAAPLYRIEIISKDYLDAENILSDALEIVEERVNQNNGTYDFIRE